VIFLPVEPWLNWIKKAKSKTVVPKTGTGPPGPSGKLGAPETPLTAKETGDPKNLILKMWEEKRGH
jgi:hypothetical protein